MTVFVAIPRLNGRNDLATLAEKLMRLGFEDTVEYNEGGWHDQSVQTAYPHLKFEDEQDATAYVLAFGGIVSRTVPGYIIAGG